MDYDSWKCGWADCESPSLCKHCENNEQNLYEASEYFEEILQQIYGIKKFDSENLENCLNEIASYLKVKFKFGDLKIQEKKERVPLHAWIEFNHSYLKSITKKEYV